MEFIGEALAFVGETEREVVALLYGFEGPRFAPEEIAQLRGMSPDQIEPTVMQVTRRMRHPTCVRILEEALVSADEQIWRSVAGAVGIVYKSGSLTAMSASVPGELLFAIDCLYGSLENWLPAHARATAKGWYRSPFPEEEIERLFTMLAQPDEFPLSLPMPLEDLAREMQAEASALETAVRLSSVHWLYSGYVAAWGGARAARAIRLHRILSGGHSGEVIPRRRLLALYRSEFADDDCTVEVAEVSMAAFPHLFLRVGELGWCGIGAAGSQQRTPDRPADSDAQVTFYRLSAGRKSQQETPDIEVVRQVLEEHGPLQLVQIEHFVRKQSRDSISPASITQCLNSGEHFLRLAPGVFGLESQLTSESQWTEAQKLLLHRGDCLRFIQARLAGEPADAYPLWTPAMEAEWCEWAQDRQKKLLGSLLAVTDPSSWPIPDSSRAVWLSKKEGMQPSQFEEPAEYPLTVFPIADLLGLVKCARWRGAANWVMANRATGDNMQARGAACWLALLVGVGVVFPASQWQKPHDIAPDAGEIDDRLSCELHRTGALAWDGDSGRWLLERLAQSIDRVETGWVPRAELERLLALIRDPGHARDDAEAGAS